MNLYLGAALLLALLAAGLGWNNYLDEREAFNTFKGVQAGLANKQAERERQRRWPNMSKQSRPLSVTVMLLLSACGHVQSIPTPIDCPVPQSPPKELQSSASTVQDLSPRFELLLEEFRTSLQKEMKR
jgi:hypothetical protein